MPLLFACNNVIFSRDKTHFVLNKKKLFKRKQWRADKKPQSVANDLGQHHLTMPQKDCMLIWVEKGETNLEILL